MIIDTHAHLADPKFTSYQFLDEEEIKIISIGCNYSEIIKSYELTQIYPSKIYSTAGVYPHYVIDSNQQKTDNQLIKQVLEYSQKDSVVAIGECGIDLTTPPPWEKTRSIKTQLDLFYQQLNIAKKVDKPVIIHSRNASVQTIEFLTTNHNLITKAVWHCYTEDLHTAKKLLDLGILLSFTGIITYKNTDYLSEVIKQIGINNLMIETDAPYLTPEPLRKMGKKSNSPQYVKIVAQKVAEILSLPIEQVIQKTTQTAVNFFNIK